MLARSGCARYAVHQFEFSLCHLVVLGAVFAHRGEYVPDYLQHVPCRRHFCLLLSAALCDPLVDRLHPRIESCGDGRRVHHHVAQLGRSSLCYAAAHARLPAVPVRWGHAGVRDQLLVGREPGHVDDLGYYGQSYGLW